MKIKIFCKRARTTSKLYPSKSKTICTNDFNAVFYSVQTY